MYTLKCGFPAFFELCRNQSIVWIASGIAPLRERGPIPGLLQLQFHDALLFALGLQIPALGLQCGLNSQRLDRTQQLVCDCHIDAHSNDIWSADFKGQFKTFDSIYCYPLTVTDSYSRFLLGCQALLWTILLPMFPTAHPTSE